MLLMVSWYGLCVFKVAPRECWDTPEASCQTDSPWDPCRSLPDQRAIPSNLSFGYNEALGVVSTFPTTFKNTQIRTTYPSAHCDRWMELTPGPD